jgi:hypothetical protein
MAITDTETFRALVSQGPVVIMVEKTHMLALLDERDELRDALVNMLMVLDCAHQANGFISTGHVTDTKNALTKTKNILFKNNP